MPSVLPPDDLRVAAEVRVAGDPVYAGSDGGLALAQDAPKSDWEKLSA